MRGAEIARPCCGLPHRTADRTIEELATVPDESDHMPSVLVVSR